MSKFVDFEESSAPKEFSAKSDQIDVAAFNWCLCAALGDGEICRSSLLAVLDTPCKFNIDID